MDTAKLLQRLLTPVDAQQFLETHFNQQAVIIPRDVPGFFSDLVTMRDVEELVLSLAPQGDRKWFQLAKDGQYIAIKPPLIDEHGDIVPAQVFRSYYSGTTIVLNQTQRRSCAMRQYCKALEDVLIQTTGLMLKAPIFANIYLTPPNSQGFSVHCDDHDVFVLQVEGSKTWRLYKPPVNCPLEPITSFTGYALGQPTHTQTLRAGTVLYLPRGVPHEGLTNKEHSLHVTLGMRAFTKLDLLVGLAKSSVEMRRSLLIRDDVELQGLASGYLQSITEALDDHRRMSSAVKQLRNYRLMSSLPPEGEYVKVINALETISESSFVTRRSPEYRLTEFGTHVRVHGPGVVATYTSNRKSALRLSLNGENVQVKDLPGFESASERIEFVKKLVGDGFLTIAEVEQVAVAT